MGNSAQYATQDIRYAAFLKTKGVPLADVRLSGAPGRKFCTYLFEISKEEEQRMWRIFQNPGEERMVDAARLLEEYENMKTQRIKR